MLSLHCNSDYWKFKVHNSTNKEIKGKKYKKKAMWLYSTIKVYENYLLSAATHDFQSWVSY